MATILQLIGMLTLLAVAALVVAFFWLRHRLRRFAESLGGTFAPRITLTPHPDKLPAEMEERVAVFESSGFERAGVFRVREMKGLVVAGLVDEPGSRLAAVYQSPEAGTWSDVVVYFEPAGGVTASNSPFAGRLGSRPGHKKITDPSLDERALLQRLDEAIPPRARRPVSSGEFVAVFEEAYADEMDWFLGRGGASLDEVKRIAESMDGEFTEEEIAEAQAAIREQASQALTETCRSAFAATMDGASWERIRDRSVIVHEQMTPSQVWTAMEECLCELDDDVLSEDDYDAVSAGASRILETSRPALSLADAINALVPDRARLRVEETLSEPVAAVLYVAP